MLCHSIYVQVVKVHLFNLGLPMNRYTFVLPSENQNAICANAVYTHDQIFLQRYTRKFEIHELEIDEIQKEHTSLSLDLSMHFDFPKGCACTSLSLSLSLFLCLHLQKRFGSRSDPNGIQERMFHKLKKNVHTKANAHDKMGFQYISISVYIVWSHARIQRGDRGSRPP